jgi:glycerol-3-phosphate dehydrogenase (NAD(P)+)
MKIAVLGAGAWGTALAINLLKNSNSRHEITLWTKDSGHCAELLQEHTNRQFLPGFPLPESLQLTSDLNVAVKADLALIVVPTAGLRETLREIVSCGKVERDVT